MIYYRSANQYFKEKFGEKVYKIALDGNFTCPNRDGTKGYGGCIFCRDGSGDFAVSCGEDINGAIDDAIAVLGKKGKGRYIAYFQSHTNTYGNPEKLERLFMGAAKREDIAALSIATRPDCLGSDVMDVIAKVNGIKPVFVELGLQTIHEKTAEYIRRGYNLDVYDEAMTRLKAAGIETVVHMILGLPGENIPMMAKTSEYISKSGADGIKFQLLHVLHGTDLEKDYLDGKFDVMTLDGYIEALCACVKAAGENIIVHRLTGDGAKRDLVAPLWSADKKRVLNEIAKELRPIESN